MSFNTFKRVAAVFVGAIVALACVVAWQMNLSTEQRLVSAVVFVSIILGAGLFLQKAIAPTPTALVSIDFLQNNFANLHMDTLFNSSSLHIDFGRELLSRDPMMHFSIRKKLLFLGYKFLFVVSDAENTRAYFLSYGYLTGRVDFQHLWTPDFGMFSISIGDFSASRASQVSPLMTLHFWLFVPTPMGWVKERKLHPRFLSEPVSEALGNQVGWRLNSSDCTWSMVDEHITFDRNFRMGFARWRIVDLAAPNAQSPQSVFQTFQGRLEHCKGIRAEDHPTGLLIG